MSIPQKHVYEISMTLDPRYGPETPDEAADRLLRFYSKLDEGDRIGFVSALIGELLTLKQYARTLKEIHYADSPAQDTEATTL